MDEEIEMVYIERDKLEKLEKENKFLKFQIDEYQKNLKYLDIRVREYEQQRKES